jgi:hypothetical protein
MAMRPGNVVATDDGEVFLLDLERFSVGPPEWDLVATAIDHTTFGILSHDGYKRFCQSDRPSEADFGGERGHDGTRDGARRFGEAVDVVDAGEDREMAGLEPLVQLGVVSSLVEGAHGQGDARRPPAGGPRVMRALQLFERPNEVAEGVAADRRVGQELAEVVEPLGGAGAAQRRIGADMVDRPANERRHLVGSAAVPDHLVDRTADVDDDVVVAGAEPGLEGVTCRTVNVPAARAHPPCARCSAART